MKVTQLGGSGGRRIGFALAQALQHRCSGRPGAAAEAFGFEPVGDRVPSGARIERLHGGIGRGVFGLPLTQPPQRGLGFGQANRAVIRRMNSAGPQPPHRFRGVGDPPAALKFVETMRGAGSVPAQPEDFLGKHRPRLPHGVAVGLHHGDGLGRFGRKILAARGEGGCSPVFQVGDPGQGRIETLAFGLVLGDRHCERPLGPVDAGSGIADMLVENQERATIDRLLFGGVHSAAYQSPKRLDHGW